MNEKVNDQIPILTFGLGDKRYAMFIDQVVEVAAMMQYSPIADSIPAILGIVNRHGEVVPLIDLRIVFGLSAPPITTNVFFIVAQQEQTLAGLVVDAVHQVEYIHQGDLRVAPGGGRWIQQVAGYHDDLLQIIDLSAILINLLPETLNTQ